MLISFSFRRGWERNLVQYTKCSESWNVSKQNKIIHYKMVTLLLIAPGLLAFATLFLYPMLITLTTSFQTRDSSNFTFNNYLDFLTKSEGWNILGLSFFLAIIPTIIIIFISIPLALLLRKKITGFKFYRTLIVLPLMIPSLISTLGLLLFYNTNGWFNLFIIKLLPFVNEPAKINYTIHGLMIFYVWLYFPYTAISITSAIEGLDKGIEEAGSVCGASPMQVFWKIILPLIKPGIMSGSIMTFLLAFGSFSVPLLAGGDYRPIAVQIYTTTAVFHNWPKGSALAVIMSVIQVIFLTIYMRLNRRRNT